MSRGLVGRWQDFNPSNIGKLMSPGRLFVVRRGGGKVNVGEVQGMDAHGVTLSNGSWTYRLEFNDGKRSFVAVDPPALTEVKTGDPRLV